MRIKVNRRYYCKLKFGEDIYFGYFYKHRNVQDINWDYNGNRVEMRYRIKGYSTNPDNFSYSSSQSKERSQKCMYVVTDNIKSV